MPTIVLVAGALALAALLAYHRGRAVLWIAAYAALLSLASWRLGATPGVAAGWIALALAAVLLHPGPLRRQLVSRAVLGRFRRALPPLSDSEREALEAGTVWWDGELLTGDPDWRRLASLRGPALTAEERAYLDGPVDELCEMLDEWRVTRELHDLPPEAWDHIRRHRMLGMIIPKAYGGLGFSAIAHSEVIMKLTSRSATAAVSVMVPNALGPAELLLGYGTQAQKDHYLPRLAQGIEIPCLALTSPYAGSDATAIPDFGIVCRGTWQGRSGVLGMRITWEKRYITLGPVATLIGLAFRLRDPDRLIGPRADVGITLALVPADTPGVHIGRRHMAMDAAFMTGPNWGRDVFVPLSCIIGGAERAGQGWSMLMNCLAAGRGVSLPANSCGIAKLCARTAGAYSRVRRQFGLPIGRFEGIEAALARIAGHTYVMDAARRATAAALDAGERPSVATAIVKYHLTERVRVVVNDAMDIHAGKAICMGPGNYLAQAYQQVPIAITVEGANILTRSMIIFGQGIVRGHPYLLREMAACREADDARAVKAFDAAFFAHLGFFARNAARAAWLATTGGRMLDTPGDRLTRRHYRRVSRYSSALAFLADAVLAAVGGNLKRRERISARLGDVLSGLYLASCVLKRYEDDGCPADDRALLQWAMADSFLAVETAMRGVLDNLRPAALAAAARAIVFPPGAGRAKPPSDRLDAEVARCILEPGAARDRLTAGVFVPRRPGDPVAALEAALQAVIVSEPLEARLRETRIARNGSGRDRVRAGVAAGVLSEAEARLLRRADALAREAIMVDDFPPDLRSDGASRTSRPVVHETDQQDSEHRT